MSRNVVVGVGLLALAVAYWVGADAIPVSPLSGSVGADGLPKLLAVALGVLSCILIVQSVARSRQTGTKADPSAENAADARRRHLRAAGMLAIGVGYLVVVQTVGYLLSVALLIGATAMYSGRRPSLALLLVIVIASGVFYLLFVRVLNVPLPPGIWPELLRGLA